MRSTPAQAPLTEHRWVPLGPATALGLLRNVFGDTSMIARAAAFRADGGFSERPGLAVTDWSVGCRMHTAPLMCEGSCWRAQH